MSVIFAAARDELPVTRCDFTRRLEEDAAAPPAHTDSSCSLSGSQAPEIRRDAASGRVRRREGRKRRFRSRRLLHASPHHPQTAFVGKPPLLCVGILISGWAYLQAPLSVSVPLILSGHLRLAFISLCLLSTQVFILNQCAIVLQTCLWIRAFTA